MYVQVIEGRVGDREGLQRQLDRWVEELAPGAVGWLGTTGGVGEDGTLVLAARFESEEAAAANSNRPEQGAWWDEADARKGEQTEPSPEDAEAMGRVASLMQVDRYVDLRAPVLRSPG